MFGVDRVTSGGTTEHNTGLLETLLVGIVAMLAQRLPVGAIPEQLHVTVMGLDMINHCRLGDATMAFAFGAERVMAKPAKPRLLPAIVIGPRCRRVH